MRETRERPRESEREREREQELENQRERTRTRERESEREREREHEREHEHERTTTRANEREREREREHCGCHRACRLLAGFRDTTLQSAVRRFLDGSSQGDSTRLVGFCGHPWQERLRGFLKMGYFRAGAV